MPSVTIYLSQDVMDDVTHIAKEQNLSVSKILSRSFRNPVKKDIVTKSVDGRLDEIECKLARIESKLDGLFGREKNGSKTRAFFEISHKDVKGTPTDVIEKAYKEKPKKVIKTVGDVPGWAGGYSKSKQLGKKK